MLRPLWKAPFREGLGGVRQCGKSECQRKDSGLGVVLRNDILGIVFSWQVLIVRQGVACG